MGARVRRNLLSRAPWRKRDSKKSSRDRCFSWGTTPSPPSPAFATLARMKSKLAFAAPLAFALAACSSPPPRTAHDATRPLDPHRAIPLIAEAFDDTGIQPAGPREIQLPTGKKLRVDVSATGHKWGIAYLTSSDIASLDPKSDLPPRPTNDDLAIVQGHGPDSGSVVLILFADEYRADDHLGEKRQNASIVAEKKLQRDVRDFVVQAKARNLP